MTRAGLYLHIPFCVKKCDYCDFLSGRGSVAEQNSYAEALLREIENTKLPEKYIVDTIFIGGGTPTVISEEWIICFMKKIRERFQVSEDAEISMEANPGTLTEEKLLTYRKAGINRLSIGLQSADNVELSLLGRIHTYEEFLENYQKAREAGFQNINIDLMMAIPGQDKASWMRTLARVVKLRPEHISAYSLIVEPGTPFDERELVLPDEDEEREMYEEGASFLSEWGYRQYEISNFAKPGRECHHNVGYWRRKPYLGLGLGAASLLDETRFHNTTDRAEYERESKRPELLRRDVEELSHQAQMEEFMFLGLRMLDGVCVEAFKKKFAKDIHEVYGTVIERYVKEGFLKEKEGRLFLTRPGISVSNQIMAEFLL